MQYSEQEKKAYVKKVVDIAKKEAKVDTGFLKRSIRGNWFRDIATFREVFYGAYNGNSKLIEIAKRIMPNDIPWKVVFVDEDGNEAQVEGKTRTGRKISRKEIGSENVSSKNIKALIASIKARGEKKNDTGEANREADN